MRALTAASVLVLTLCTACGVTAPKQPPGAPPTPTSVTRDNPGGDADEPERAALTRLAEQPWGERLDFWKTLRTPLPDAKKWRRVKFWGHPMRVSYRYGDDHYAVVTVWYQPVSGASDPEACLARFLEFAMPVARSYSVTLGPMKTTLSKHAVRGKARRAAIATVEGQATTLGTERYLGAIVAYDSWPGTCLVQGVAVLATEHPDLAERVRTRWLDEGLRRLDWAASVKTAPEPKAR